MKGYATLHCAVVAGRQLSWREAGQGRAVVLLHGISSGAASWVKQLEDTRLTGCCRLLAWDAPGYGDSADLQISQPDADDYAQILAHWLSAIGVTRALLVGHSLGALIASAYAVRHPTLVSGLVLADAAVGYGDGDTATRERVFEQRRQAIEVLGAAEYAHRRAAYLLRDGAAEEDIERVQAGMRRLRATGFLSAAWMLANDHIGRYLSAYCGELQIWCGEQDRVTPPAGAAALAARYGAPCYLLPAAGHASYLDAPAAFNDHLLRLMAEMDRVAIGVKES